MNPTVFVNWKCMPVVPNSYKWTPGQRLQEGVRLQSHAHRQTSWERGKLTGESDKPRVVRLRLIPTWNSFFAACHPRSLPPFLSPSSCTIKLRQKKSHKTKSWERSWASGGAPESKHKKDFSISEVEVLLHKVKSKQAVLFSSVRGGWPRVDLAGPAHQVPFNCFFYLLMWWYRVRPSGTACSGIAKLHGTALGSLKHPKRWGRDLQHPAAAVKMLLFDIHSPCWPLTVWTHLKRFWGAVTSSRHFMGCFRYLNNQLEPSTNQSVDEQAVIPSPIVFVVEDLLLFFVSWSKMWRLSFSYEQITASGDEFSVN